MRVNRSRLQDCLQYHSTLSTAERIAVICDMDCEHCGFYAPEAERRTRRIKAGDWSSRIGPRGKLIVFLKLRKKEK